VFWERYIEPFLEDISIRIINETLTLCKEKDQEPDPALRETAEMLKSLIKITYEKMVDVDKQLRSKGHKENVAQRSVQKEVSVMEDFVEKRIKSELAMWSRPKKIHKFIKEHPLLVILIPAIVSVLLGTLINSLYQQYQNSSLDKSFRRAVQQELQKARDDLDWTIAYRDLNIRRLVVFNLVYKVQVPSRFSENQALSADIQSLYDSLNSAKKSAEHLYDLLAKKNADKETISNHEGAIKRAINRADEIGPQIANLTGVEWKILPGNLSPQERVKHFESLSITTGAATDSQVQVKSISPLSK
jgi:hypothetical protein